MNSRTRRSWDLQARRVLIRLFKGLKSCQAWCSQHPEAWYCWLWVGSSLIFQDIKLNSLSPCQDPALLTETQPLHVYNCLACREDLDSKGSWACGVFLQPAGKKQEWEAQEKLKTKLKYRSETGRGQMGCPFETNRKTNRLWPLSNQGSFRFERHSTLRTDFQNLNCGIGWRTPPTTKHRWLEDFHTKMTARMN